MSQKTKRWPSSEKRNYQHGDHGEQYRGNGDVWEPRSSRESRSYRLQWSEIRVAQELRHVSRVYWILLSRICSYSARRASTFSPNTMLGGGCVVIIPVIPEESAVFDFSFIQAVQRRMLSCTLEGGWSRLAQRTRGNQDLRENRVWFVFNRLQHFALVGNKYITWLLTLVLRINFSPVAPNKLLGKSIKYFIKYPYRVSLKVTRKMSFVSSELQGVPNEYFSK